MKQGNNHPTIYFWNYTAISRFAWICICASSAWAVWIRNRMANPSTDVKKSKRFWLLPWSYFSQSDLDVYHISDGVRPGKPSGFILKCWSQDDTFLNVLLKKEKKCVWFPWYPPPPSLVWYSLVWPMEESAGQQLSSLFICGIIMEKDRLLVIQQSIIDKPSLIMWNRKIAWGRCGKRLP